VLQMIDREDERLLGSALTRLILRCAISVHRALGPGLLESAYRSCPVQELNAEGLSKLSDLHVGLLLNFHTLNLRQGLRRFVI
jgi:hypothetical protein